LNIKKKRANPGDALLCPAWYGATNRTALLILNFGKKLMLRDALPLPGKWSGKSTVSGEIMESNQDFRDLFQCLNDADAKYLIVGAYAVIFHTEPRFTKDLDVWVEPTRENAAKVWKALEKFGAPMTGLTIEDLCNPEMIYQVGIEPNRFDIIMDIKSPRFSDAWKNRITSNYEDQTVYILNLDDLIRSKKIAGRPQDLLDVKSLETKKKT